MIESHYFDTHAQTNLLRGAKCHARGGGGWASGWIVFHVFVAVATVTLTPLAFRVLAAVAVATLTLGNGQQ